jgi:Asp-tRNA(Asn)/Glu-tRNA(Gln) amidotransferase A subunit family amidase
MAAFETQRAVEETAARLGRAGAIVSEVEPGPELADLFEAQKTIMAVEIARSFAALRRERGALLSASFREVVDSGAATPPERYQAMLALAERARGGLLRAFFGGADALLTPSAPGEAPAGLESTGDPAFCRIWTLLHLPCVNVPGASGPRGLPIGVQLVGRPGGDAELLATSEWIADRLQW